MLQLLGGCIGILKSYITHRKSELQFLLLLYYNIVFSLDKNELNEFDSGIGNIYMYGDSTKILLYNDIIPKLFIQ
jgi:hypothetical protein